MGIYIDDVFNNRRLRYRQVEEAAILSAPTLTGTKVYACGMVAFAVGIRVGQQGLAASDRTNWYSFAVEQRTLASGIGT